MLLGVDADVYFTGEMAHHEVLAAVASGHNVVLCMSPSKGMLSTGSHLPSQAATRIQSAGIYLYLLKN